MSADWLSAWAEVTGAAVALLALVAAAVSVLIAYRELSASLNQIQRSWKDRLQQQQAEHRQRHVATLRRFASDFYNNEDEWQLFLEIEGDEELDFDGDSRQRVALAHLLETLNAIACLIDDRSNMLEIDDIRESSIAYVMVATWDRDEVKEWVLHPSTEKSLRIHRSLEHDYRGFKYFVRLAEALVEFRAPT